VPGSLRRHEHVEAIPAGDLAGDAGVALLLLVSPALIGFLVLGMSAGILLRLRLRASRQPSRPSTRDRNDRRRRIRRS